MSLDDKLQLALIGLPVIAVFVGVPIIYFTKFRKKK